MGDSKRLPSGGAALSQNDNVLAYIARAHGDVSVTALLKLAYLIDYVSVQKNGEKVSDFNYIRYNYGPFDKSVYDSLARLIDAGVLSERVEFNPYGDFMVYSFCNDANYNPGKTLTVKQKKIADGILAQLNGHGPKMLTEVAYETPPLASVGAKIGNRVHMNKSLDLKIGPKKR